jgi:hypothetical protein
MKAFSHYLKESILRGARSLAGAWNGFWFTSADPTTLAAIRICTGLVLLFVYLACTLDLLSFIGPNSWVDGRAIDHLRNESSGGKRWWGLSLWFFVQNPSAIYGLHFAFLAAIVCFTLGLFTRTMSVLVWVGHLSFIQRAFLTWSGMDTVLAMLTFYLMFAPAGAALSLDRRRRHGDRPPEPSWSANLVVRMIQIHMCVIYLCSGLGKLQGARWWDGTAVWMVMMLHEFAPVDMSWLGHLGDWPCLLLSNLGVALTLGTEISFAFLIWNPRLRPVLLFLAILMHAGIGLFMGMGSFGAIMLTGCLSFVAPGTIRRIVENLRNLRARIDALPRTPSGKKAA